MTAAAWWRRRAPWEKVLLIGIPGMGVGLGVGVAVDRWRERRDPALGGFTYEELPNLLDYESEDPSEPEPAEIVYDPNDSPCVEEEPPLEPGQPVAMGFEGEEFCTPPADLEPKIKTDVPMAEGGERPHWPVLTDAKRKIQVSYEDVRGMWHGRWGRHFSAPRESKTTERNHSGLDLFADPGDVVVSTEGGEVLATLPFYKGTGAVYVLTDSGLVINYGELERYSWSDYGIESGVGKGQRIKAGQRLGRVGLSDDGSHMLHVETYHPVVTIDRIRKGDMQWINGEPAPPGLLDPTRYLVRAQRVKHEQMIEEA